MPQEPGEGRGAGGQRVSRGVDASQNRGQGNGCRRRLGRLLSSSPRPNWQVMVGTTQPGGEAGAHHGLLSIRPLVSRALGPGIQGHARRTHTRPVHLIGASNKRPNQVHKAPGSGPKRLGRVGCTTRTSSATSWQCQRLRAFESSRGERGNPMSFPRGRKALVKVI